MSEDRLLTVVERRSKVLMATAFLSAGYLFLVGISDWNEGNLRLFSLFEVSGWLRSALLVASVGAFTACIVVMLIAVSVEARRIRAFHESLDWTQTRPADAEVTANRVPSGDLSPAAEWEAPDGERRVDRR